VIGQASKKNKVIMK